MLDLEALALQDLTMLHQQLRLTSDLGNPYFGVLLRCRKVPRIELCRIFACFRQDLVEVASDAYAVHIPAKLPDEAWCSLVTRCRLP